MELSPQQPGSATATATIIPPLATVIAPVLAAVTPVIAPVTARDLRVGRVDLFYL